MIEWRAVPGWENYSVSSNGSVRGPRKILRLFPNARGYLTCQLSRRDEPMTIGVARLVAMAFIPNFDGALQVDHIDGDKTNNSIDNLRMATNSENAKNRPTYKTNSLGLKGVSFHKRRERYIARIQFDSKRVNLGEFRTAEEASSVYLKAAEEKFGKFNRGAPHEAS